MRDYKRIKGILDREGRGNHSLNKETEHEKAYRANPEYLEECTFIVIVEMLERIPRLKPRIKKYLETFPS